MSKVNFVLCFESCQNVQMNPYLSTLDPLALRDVVAHQPFMVFVLQIIYFLQNMLGHKISGSPPDRICGLANKLPSIGIT